MELRGPDRVADAGPKLAELAGATLAWWGYCVSLGEFRLIASGLPDGLQEILLGGTWYLDCPVRMHDARLRVATPSEHEALRHSLPSYVGEWLGWQDHLVIESREGCSPSARKWSSFGQSRNLTTNSS